MRGDVRDQALLERVLGEYEIETVIHLAAQTIVTIANRNPVSTFETNIAGTWALLEACRRSPKVKQIVIASSDKAYGDHDKLPYAEETPLRRPAPVRRQQVVRRPDRADVRDDLRLAGGHHALRQLLRRRRSQLEPHRARDHPLGRCAASARSSAPTASSSATTSTSRTAPSPTCCSPRSWPPIRASRGGPSTSRTRSSSPCASSSIGSSRLMGSTLEPDVRNEASHEILHQYLSAAAARRDLGWTPRFTLDDGLARTIAWYRDFFEAAEPPRERPPCLPLLRRRRSSS